MENNDNGPRLVETTVTESNPTPSPPPVIETNTKFCKHCGEKIAIDAVLCVKCGRQVEELAGAANAGQPNIVITNTNTNANTNINDAFMAGRQRSKWTAVLLCFFLGVFGAHKFYEGKTGMGILYLLTGGLCGIGALIDFIVLLFKPDPYYV